MRCTLPLCHRIILYCGIVVSTEYIIIPRGAVPLIAAHRPTSPLSLSSDHSSKSAATYQNRKPAARPSRPSSLLGRHSGPASGSAWLEFATAQTRQSSYSTFIRVVHPLSASVEEQVPGGRDGPGGGDGGGGVAGDGVRGLHLTLAVGPLASL